MELPLAAAGPAEAAWLFGMLLMNACLVAICLVAGLAAIVRSRVMAVIALVLLIAFCIFFQPWYCFAPFEAEAYADPDVVSAAGEFQFVGAFWVVTSALTIGR